MTSLSSFRSAKSNVPLISFLLGAGIGLQAFGSVYRPEFLGYLSASPGVILLLAAAILSLPHALDFRATRYAWLLVLWGVIASAFSLSYFGWSDLYASKVFPLLILSIAWMAPLLCLKALTFNTLRIGLAVGIAISVLGYLLSDLFPSLLPNSLRDFLFGGGYDVYYDDRPRAFMTEPSHFGALVGRYAILLYLLSELGRTLSRIRLGLSLLIIAAALLLTGSKGAAVALILSLVMLATNRRAIGLLLLILPIFWWLFASQFNAFAIDLDRFTSTATRTGMALAGVGAISLNPFGWGYYGFYGTMKTFGSWAMETLYGFPFRFDELEVIIGDLTSVSYKSTMIDFAVVFGWPFIAYVFWLLRQIDLRDVRVSCATAFILVLSLSTAGHESISFFLGIAVLMRYFPKRPFPN